MKRFLLMFAALAMAGCSSSATSGEPPTTYSSAQARWEAEWGDDYRFDFDRSCFCVVEAVEPVTIEVRDGRITSVVSRNTGRPVEAHDGLEWFTIKELFLVIEEAEASGEAVQVKYADEGYPSRIEIGQIAADAGVIYGVSNVLPL